MMPYDPARRLAAEFAGSALLLATVVGSGIMAETASNGNVALALLANTIATGAILVVLITMFGPVSGAHFNPAVTLVFFLRGEMPARMAALYVPIQVCGALTGVALAHAMFGQEIMQISMKVRTGGSQWLSEGVAAFGLVLTILATLRSAPERVPMAVGLYIVAAYWFTASTSFANPAVTIARAFSNSFAGIRPVDAPGFIVAQIAGALVALIFAHWLLSVGKGKARLR
jgi:glycerol uptake facilitator-like aquaporin